MALIDDADDEAFRLEFLNRMSAILGFPPPRSQPKSLNASGIADKKAEVTRLRALMQQYQDFAKEISNGANLNDKP